MPRLFADASGVVFQYLRQPAMEDAYSDPVGAVLSFRFDEYSNGALAEDITVNFNSYTLSGSVDGSILLKDGTPVAVTASSQRYNDRRALALIWQKLTDDENLTQAELRRILRWIVRQIRDGDA